MNITVNFDCNWNKNDVDALLENTDLSAEDLDMDFDDYLEVIAIAALMKRKNLAFNDAIKEAHEQITSTLEEFFSKELLPSYLYFYRQALTNEI